MRFLILLLLPCFCIAQKIKVSAYDKFIKQYRIETNTVTLKAGLDKGLSLGVRSVGSTIFIRMEGYNVISGVVPEGGDVIFLFDNDSTLTIHSKDIQTTSTFKYGQSFKFEYYASKADLEKLKTAMVKSIRLYSVSSYHDVDIKEGDAKDINGIAALFLEEYNSKKSEIDKGGK